MSTPDDTRSVLELRQMDRDQARQQLTVVEFERWEQLRELEEGAQETRDRWDEEDQQVADVVVRADPEQLGTEVDVFGNGLLVRIDSESDEVRAAAERLEGVEGDLSDPESLDDDAAAELVDALLDLLDAILLRWNDTDWGDLNTHQRETILADAKAAWGVDGLLLAWVDIVATVREDREERVDVIDSFR